MKKFEYEEAMVADSDYDKLLETLNVAGDMGWEVVSTTDTGHGTTFLLKREKEEPQGFVRRRYLKSRSLEKDEFDRPKQDEIDWDIDINQPMYTRDYLRMQPEEHHDENTLMKVRSTLAATMGVPTYNGAVGDLMLAMHEAGILFRERT